jgi:two-component system sensor histidine kinase UhpB
MLDDLGLLPTLRWHLKSFRQRTKIEVNFEAIEMDERLDQDMETTLYRIIQEALNNISKHAEAKKVTVRLHRKEDLVAGYIEDDGRGFDVDEILMSKEPDAGIGLVGMDERTAVLSGSLAIESRKGHGTRISFELPLPERKI